MSFLFGPLSLFLCAQPFISAPRTFNWDDKIKSLMRDAVNLHTTYRESCSYYWMGPINFKIWCHFLLVLISTSSCYVEEMWLVLEQRCRSYMAGRQGSKMAIYLQCWKGLQILSGNSHHCQDGQDRPNSFGRFWRTYFNAHFFVPHIQALTEILWVLGVANLLSGLPVLRNVPTYFEEFDSTSEACYLPYYLDGLHAFLFVTLPCLEAKPSFRLLIGWTILKSWPAWMRWRSILAVEAGMDDVSSNIFLVIPWH